MSDSPQYTPVPPQAAQSGLSDNTAGALAYVHKESFGPDILEEIWAKRPTGQP